MTECRLSLPPSSEQVRLARLVVCTAARRVGLAEEVLDEVRLAVGEATARAVVRHTDTGCTDPIDLDFGFDGVQFEVRVRDAVDARVTDTDFGLAMAVILGLVPDAAVMQTPNGGELLTMSWPVPDIPAQ